MMQMNVRQKWLGHPAQWAVNKQQYWQMQLSVSFFSCKDEVSAIREGERASVVLLCGRKDEVRASLGPKVVGSKALLDSGVICLDRSAVSQAMRK